jgi:hypothetical protein
MTDLGVEALILAKANLDHHHHEHREEHAADDGAYDGGKHPEVEHVGVDVGTQRVVPILGIDEVERQLQDCTTRREKRKEEKATTSGMSSNHVTPGSASHDWSPARLWSWPGVTRDRPMNTTTMKSEFTFTISCPCSSDIGSERGAIVQ